MIKGGFSGKWTISRCYLWLNGHIIWVNYFGRYIVGVVTR